MNRIRLITKTFFSIYVCTYESCMLIHVKCKPIYQRMFCMSSICSWMLTSYIYTFNYKKNLYENKWSDKWSHVGYEEELGGGCFLRLDCIRLGNGASSGSSPSRRSTLYSGLFYIYSQLAGSELVLNFPVLKILLAFLIEIILLLKYSKIKNTLKIP